MSITPAIELKESHERWYAAGGGRWRMMLGSCTRSIPLYTMPMNKSRRQPSRASAVRRYCPPACLMVFHKIQTRNAAAPTIARIRGATVLSARLFDGLPQNPDKERGGSNLNGESGDLHRFQQIHQCLHNIARRHFLCRGLRRGQTSCNHATAS